MPAFPTGTTGNVVFEREQRWRGYLQEIRLGSGQALTRLYDEVSPVLYGLALRMVRNHADAEEVLLDVFEQVWHKAASFEPDRGTVWRWLALLTRSRAVDRLRSDAGRRKREQMPGEEESDIRCPEPLPDETTIFREQHRMIRQALERLPTEQRRAIELACFSGLTHTEIAAALAVPLGTIKTRIRMGIDKLRTALAEPRAAAQSPAE